MPWVAVLGPRGVVGPYLLRRLAERGYSGECLGRVRPELPEGFAWRGFDVGRPGDWRAPDGAVVFSTLPLAKLAEVLDRCRGASQVIALGSTSIHVKADSPDPAERRLVAGLRRGEEALARCGVPWTLLRPTLIYDLENDANLAAVARVIRRFGVFPVAAPANGLRQPIHADDVAQAMVAAAGNPAARDSAFDLPGSETVTYRDMVRRVGKAIGRPPVILPLPAGLLAVGLGLAARVRKTEYSPALFQRMNHDLAFDGAAARAALGIAPRPFLP